MKGLFQVDKKSKRKRKVHMHPECQLVPSAAQLRPTKEAWKEAVLAGQVTSNMEILSLLYEKQAQATTEDDIKYYNQKVKHREKLIKLGYV